LYWQVGFFLLRQAAIRVIARAAGVISAVPGGKGMNVTSITDWQKDLTAGEAELLHEVALALRTIRYGSMVLTVHDGRIVELNKTERIRKSGT
jgi:hypothetical protein